MLYRRTPELPPLNLNIGSTELSDFYPSEAASTSAVGEFFNKALWIETSLTKDISCNLPTPIAQTVVSRKYNVYYGMKFFDEISAKKAHITEISVQTISSNYISSSEKITTNSISTNNISVGDTFNVTVLTSNEIYAKELSVTTGGVIQNISGSNIYYDNAQIPTLRSTDISTQNITVSGKSILTAAATYWADLAELYESDNDYDPGTLVKFGGEKEIKLASDGVVNAVISEKPAILMNSYLKSKQSNNIVLLGRSKVKIAGPIDKFDRIQLSEFPGIGTKRNDGNAIGIALEKNKNDGINLVECVLKLAL